MEGMVHTCGMPFRLETKAMRVPSGEKLGDQEAPIFAINVTDRSKSSAAAAGLVIVSPYTQTSDARQRKKAENRSLHFNNDIRNKIFRNR